MATLRDTFYKLRMEQARESAPELVGTGRLNATVRKQVESDLRLCRKKYKARCEFVRRIIGCIGRGMK